MATANLSTRNGRPRSRLPRWARRLGWLLVLLGGAALALFWTRLHDSAQTGAAVGARLACSCRYVGGRPLGDCRQDFEPGMGLVILSEDPEAKSVTARVPLMSSQTARWRPDLGCTLDPWPN